MVRAKPKPAKCPRSFRCAILISACLIVHPSAGAAAAAATVELVTHADLAATNSAGSSDSSAPVLSGDGRFVVFLSSAQNLTTNQSSGTVNVFIRDRQPGVTELASVSPNGTAGNGPSSSPGISSNGQFVVFQSRSSNLVPGATNGWENIFVRNLTAGTTLLASANTNGVAGDYSSLNPQMTPDGRFVVFESVADDLVENDTNRLSDVFVRDLAASKTTLVSVNVAGAGSGSGYSINPSITPDGRFVVFESTAANLVTNDFNTKSDIFLRDLVAGTTTLISSGADGNAAGNSQTAAITDDGRYVAFESTANNLVAGDVDGLNDIFLRDAQTSTTTLISSLTNFNVAADAPSRPVISRDGRLVAFQTGVPPFYSFAVSTNSQIYLWDSRSGTNILLTASLDGTTPADGVSYGAAISADNRYVTFLSNATNLVAGVTNGQFQVFQRDLATGVTALVSVNRDGNGNNLDCNSASASDDGRLVAFDSLENHLVPDDSNGASDVFVRDLVANTTTLVSQRVPELPSSTPRGINSVSPGALSGDGRILVFTSLAQDLAPGDTNQAYDVFVRDLWKGTNSPVSVSTNGTAGNGSSRNAVISADGRFVTFISQATDLAPGVANPGDQLYVRDLQSGATSLLSTNASGQSGNGPSRNPSISADGRRIAFETLANDLTPGDANNASDVVVHDRSGGTNTLVSVSITGTSGNRPSRNPVITADAQFVIFSSDATNLIVADVATPAGQLFARDLANNQTFRISVDPALGPSQTAPQGGPLSGNGQLLVYTSGTNVFLLDFVTRSNALIYPGGLNASVNGDGRFVVFEKPLYGPSAPAPRTNTAIVVWDRNLQAEILASANAANSGTGNGFSRGPVISADGRWVVFKSQASDLVPDDNNGVSDVFVRDLVLGQTLLISFSQNGLASGNRLSANPIMGADGRTVIFESFASDLAANDFNETKDIFLLRLGGVDSDNDGMDDDWEMAYFSTLSRDGSGDFDGDGVSDLAEFKAGTNPTTDASIFRVVTLTSLGDGTTTVFWSAVPGKTYQLQYRNSLSDSAWTNLPGTVMANGTTAFKLDPVRGANSQGFYRVALVSP